MSAPAPRAGLGFGGAVGLGVAVVVIIAALVIGHAVLGQLEGAAHVVIVFLEIALCVILGAVVVAVVIGLGFGAQLARIHLAERREQLAGRPVMHAEVLADDAAPGAIPASQRPRVLGVQPRAIQAKGTLDSPRTNVIPLHRQRGDEGA